jgi:hypothetical protein
MIIKSTDVTDFHRYSNKKSVEFCVNLWTNKWYTPLPKSSNYKNTTISCLCLTANRSNSHVSEQRAVL